MTNTFVEPDSTKKLIVIGGATASGKTELSIEIAQKLNCSIISADSRQFYKEMTIGTAKPSKTETKRVPHYFIDSHSLSNPINAGQYGKEAFEKLSDLFNESNFIVLVGGSGLYLEALINGIDDIPGNSTIRNKLNLELEEKGLAFLQDQLLKKDPTYYKSVDLNNPIRIIRALEVIEITNKTYSSLRKRKIRINNFETHIFVINHPRDLLYKRINKRVDKMITTGLIEEVKKLQTYKNEAVLKTVGYQEIFTYLEGSNSIEAAIELIKRNSRRYAKRQITWFKRFPNAIWGSSTEILKHIEKII